MRRRRDRDRLLVCLSGRCRLEESEGDGYRKRNDPRFDVDLTRRDVFADALLEINRLVRYLIRLRPTWRGCAIDGVQERVPRRTRAISLSLSLSLADEIFNGTRAGMDTKDTEIRLG